ncbi:MAG: hypothetical protein K0R47_1453 [Brevibacillus sp.]|nr:hypothetical protein [Brevibacillus sp.]
MRKDVQIQSPQTRETKRLPLSSLLIQLEDMASIRHQPRQAKSSWDSWL